MTHILRIATRKSALALWQANFVRESLLSRHGELEVEIVGFTTEGDRNQHSPLTEIGGKGIFVKELEQALLSDRADIAVHSMKDVPGELAHGLVIGAICEREDPRDALIATDGKRFEELADGSRVGSSSLRRRLQIKEHFPGLNYGDLRGNVDTRLRKLDDGDYEGIVLAASGLRRLGLDHRVTELIDVSCCLPAAGQGALGIECRQDDTRVQAYIDVLNHADSLACVTTEREVTVRLGATCNLPIGVFAQIDGTQIAIQTYVSDSQGNRTLRKTASGPRDEGVAVARKVAAELLADGAAQLIEGA